MKAADLLKRYNRAQERWSLWRDVYRECYEYAAPERESFSNAMPGQKKNRHIVDSTAVIALPQYAALMVSAVFPPWSEWMGFEAGESIPDEEKEGINKVIEKQTKTFFSEMRASNFQTEIAQTFIDYGIGTAGILVEEEPFGSDNVLKFTTIPLSELFLEPAYGRKSIDNVWRLQQLEASLIPETWPGAKITSALKARIDKKDGLPVTLKVGMLKNDETRRYDHVVIYDNEVIFEQTFDSKRLIVFRNDVMPGETYGRGPVMNILPDIKTVNKVKEFMLQNAALQMSGVYTGVSDGIFNPYTVRIAPGSIIPVNSNNTSNPSLAALPRAGDIQLGELIISDLQANIKNALMVNPLGDVSDPVKSATEQAIRRQESLELRGASLNRLYSELIYPLVNAVVDILQTRGMLAKFKVDGREVKIRMKSSMTRIEGIESHRNMMEWLGSMQGLPPEVIATAIKIENIPKVSAGNLGISPDLIRDDVERDQLIQQAKEAASVQQQPV